MPEREAEMHLRSLPIAVTLLLAACSGRNGPDIPEAAKGQHYYSFKIGFRCKTFSPDPAGVPSWVDHLEMRGDTVLRWGNRCQDAGQPLDVAQTRQLRFTANAREIDLGGMRYSVVTDPVAEAERNAR